MVRPVIGITCNLDYNDQCHLSDNFADAMVKWHTLSNNYSQAIEQAGGIPILIPVYNQQEDCLYPLLEKLDGLMVSGGNDIDPLLFGQCDQGKCGRIVPSRDQQEIKMLKYMLEKTSKPIFCICRGFQVLNVVLGGNLYQDLMEDCHLRNHMKINYPMNEICHYVKIEPKSKLYQIINQEQLGVNSFHHQAINRLGENLKVTAWSDDGVIEAVEYDDSRFVLGVQWHPEKMYDNEQQKQIFKAFIDACNSTRK